MGLEFARIFALTASISSNHLRHRLWLDKKHVARINPAGAQIDTNPAFAVLFVKPHAGTFAEFLEIVLLPRFTEIG